MCFRRTLGPAWTVTSSRSKTVRPSREEANFISSLVSRGGGTSAISSLAASTRKRGFDVRAGAPRRSQASSLRTRFCRLVSSVAAMRSRSARAKT